MRQASFFRTWSYINPEFQSGYEWFLKNKDHLEKEVIWKTRHKRVYKIAVPKKYGGGFIAYKAYNEQRLIRYFLRYSLAYREGQGFITAENLGIPAIKVLAFGEKRFGFWLRSAFFISRFAEDYQSGRVLVHKSMNNAEKMLQDAFIRKNLQYLAYLHNAGYLHGGAHYDNFMWKLNAAGEMSVLWLDLATVKEFTAPERNESILKDVRMFLKCFDLTENEIREYVKCYQKNSIGIDVPPDFIKDIYQKKKEKKRIL